MSQKDRLAVNRNGQGSTMPNPEVVAKAQRRCFSREYKLRILATTLVRPQDSSQLP